MLLNNSIESTEDTSVPHSLNMVKYGHTLNNCVFKSCWKDRIYEVNTHERLHEAIITTGTL